MLVAIVKVPLKPSKSILEPSIILEGNHLQDWRGKNGAWNADKNVYTEGLIS